MGVLGFNIFVSFLRRDVCNKFFQLSSEMQSCVGLKQYHQEKKYTVCPFAIVPYSYWVPIASLYSRLHFESNIHHSSSNIWLGFFTILRQNIKLFTGWAKYTCQVVLYQLWLVKAENFISKKFIFRHHCGWILWIWASGAVKVSVFMAVVVRDGASWETRGGRDGVKGGGGGDGRQKWDMGEVGGGGGGYQRWGKGDNIN